MTTPVVSGDPFGTVKKEETLREQAPSPREIALAHLRSDLDSSVFAQHHTLGFKHNQSSPGDHIHDGGSSKKVPTGLSLSGKLTPGTVAEVDAILDDLINIVKFFAEFNDNRL